MTENELMLTAILNCQRTDLYAENPTLTAEQQKRYDFMRQRRQSGEPLQYIIGHCNFMGIELFVDERVLIPRPETEILVDLAIKKIKQGTDKEKLEILDMGTGSGNIAITLAKHLPHAQVTAIDISRDALEVAQHNARHNGVDKQINFIYDDLISYLKREASLSTAFDVIISNPPYIATSQLEYLPQDVQREPRVALDGGADGLYYCRKIIEYSAELLKGDGFLALEIADGQSPALKELFEQQRRYQDVSFTKDYTETDRVIFAQLAAQT